VITCLNIAISTTRKAITPVCFWPGQESHQDLMDFYLRHLTQQHKPIFPLSTRA